MAMATFASRHSSSWIDTLRRKKPSHPHTPPSASGESSPARSCVSGSVAPLSNSSSVLGSQDTAIEEVTGAVPAQQTVPASSTQTPPASEAAAPQGSAQAESAGVLISAAESSNEGDSPGGWTITLGAMQEALFGWKARATASNSPRPPSVPMETSQIE